MVVLFLLLAPSAQAGVHWDVVGHGFGHGVGMSAYGAYGYARHGKGYEFILGHYYTGRRSGPRGAAHRPRPARHLRRRRRLQRRHQRLRGGAGPGAATTRPTGRHGRRLRSSSGGRLANAGHTLRARREGGRSTIARQHLPRRAGGGADRKRRRARSTWSTRCQSTSTSRGSSPTSSPPSWPAAELQAQAVASRSFALTARRRRQRLRPLRRHPQPGLRGAGERDREDQRGRRRRPGARSSNTGASRRDLFSACSGGHTESVQNVFVGAGDPLPASASPTPTTATARCTPGS